MRKCAICEKGSKMVGKRTLLRGHYNPTNWSRKYPNLQKFVDKNGNKLLACTSCMRNAGKEARLEVNKAKKLDKIKRASELVEKRKLEREAKAKKAQLKQKEATKKDQVKDKKDSK